MARPVHDDLIVKIIANDSAAGREYLSDCVYWAKENPLVKSDLEADAVREPRDASAVLSELILKMAEPVSL